MASNPQITAGSAPISVVPSGFCIIDLLTNTNALAAGDDSYVQTWLTDGAGARWQNRVVSAEGPLTLTFKSRHWLAPQDPAAVDSEPYGR